MRLSSIVFGLLIAGFALGTAGALRVRSVCGPVHPAAGGAADAPPAHAVPDWCHHFFGATDWPDLFGNGLLAIVACIAALAYWRQAQSAVANNLMQAQQAIAEGTAKELAEARLLEDRAETILAAARKARADARRLERRAQGWRRGRDGRLVAMTGRHLELWRMTAHAEIRAAALPGARHRLDPELDAALQELVDAFDRVEREFFQATERSIRAPVAGDDGRQDEETREAGLRHAARLAAAADKVEPLALRHLEACSQEVRALVERQARELANMRAIAEGRSHRLR